MRLIVLLLSFVLSPLLFAGNSQICETYVDLEGGEPVELVKICYLDRIAVSILVKQRGVTEVTEEVISFKYKTNGTFGVYDIETLNYYVQVDLFEKGIFVYDESQETGSFLDPPADSGF